MGVQGLDSALAGFSKLAEAFGPRQMEEFLRDVGDAGKVAAADALAADIGDQSMSNWRRGNPFDLAAKYDLVHGSAVEILPRPRARGPWRVLEEGRKPGGAYDLVQVGRARKDGTRRAKSRGRNQGATAGKGTWSDALQIIEKDVPARLGKHVQISIRRAGLS